MRHLPLLLALIACNPPDDIDDTGGGGGGGGDDTGPGGTDGWSWRTDFDDASDLDASVTTAELRDGFAGGFGVIPPPLPGPYGGADALQLDDAVTAVATGDHFGTSLLVPADARPYSEGSLALYVDGDAVFQPGSQLDVGGDLELIVGGSVHVDCALIQADGSIHITAMGDIDIGCTTGATALIESNELPSALVPSNLQLDARGAITIDTEAYVSLSTDESHSLAEGGKLALHADGDITLNNRGFVSADAAVGTARTVEVWTYGAIDLDIDSFIIGTEGLNGPGGDIDVRTGTGLTLGTDCNIIAEPGGSIFEWSAGPVSLTGSSFLIAGDSFDGGPAGDVEVTAESAFLQGFSFFIPGNGEGGGAAGRTRVYTAGDVSIDDDAYIIGGDGLCVDGGGVEMRVGGDLKLTLDSYIFSGWPRTDGSCTAAASGPMDIQVAGSVTATGVSPPWFFQQDTDQNEIEVTPTDGATIDVTATSNLEWTPVVRTVAGQSSGAPVTAVDSSIDATAGYGATITVSPDGTPEAAVPLDDLVGTELSEGWWLQIDWQSGMFDGAPVDYVELTAD